MLHLRVPHLHEGVAGTSGVPLVARERKPGVAGAGGTGSAAAGRGPDRSVPAARPGRSRPVGTSAPADRATRWDATTGTVPGDGDQASGERRSVTSSMHETAPPSRSAVSSAC